MEHAIIMGFNPEICRAHQGSDSSLRYILIVIVIMLSKYSSNFSLLTFNLHFAGQVDQRLIYKFC